MDGPPQPVTIIDLDIPFGRLVAFFVKAGLAAIPATIILSLIWAGVMALFGLALRQPY